MHRTLFALLLPLAVVTSALAAPMTIVLPDETATLRPGPGVDAAGVCLACHSADYIATQPPKEGNAFWESEVQKMIKAYKAPIDPSQTPAIVNYLATMY